MLDKIPQEIVLLILSHLSTISAITTIAQVNKKLHNTIASNSETIYHAFVLRQFPTIVATRPWSQTAFNLVSRTRAWHLRALIARECAIPNVPADNPARHGRGQNFGYMPVIDSYESSTTIREETLAWGAAGRLVLRKTCGRFVKWSTWSIPDDASPHTDILDLRLLRPHQNRNRFGESIFIRRANRELALLNAMPEKDNWVKASTYSVKPDTAIDCVDVTNATQPMLAVCDSKSIRLFPVHTAGESNRAESILSFEGISTTKQRKRCAKFMNQTKLAVATQYLEGSQQAPIEVFDISTAGLSKTPLISLIDLQAVQSSRLPSIGRIGANVVANIDDMSTSAGESSKLLLSGWSDGLVRLFDLRAGSSPVRQFIDPVDDGQIFSLLPIGQERFLAGSHQNACLKMFDMRMGGQVYNYPVTPAASTIRAKQDVEPKQSQRGFNVFLAVTTNRAARPWQPLPAPQSDSRLPRYRGSIYSLSSPSPSSSKVYAGIENHVIQLDYISTDDWAGNRRGIRDELDNRPILNLSCYERPRRGRESTDAVLLRKQVDLLDLERTSDAGEAGWDVRWDLARRRSKKATTSPRWSRSDGNS